MRKQALLCQHCGLITHSKCAARAHPKCDVREQLALLAHHQDWSTDASRANSPYSSEPPIGLGISSLPAKLFSRNKSKQSLLAAPSTTSLLDGDSRRGTRRYSSGGSTPGHTSPGQASQNDPVGSLRSRLSENSEEAGGTGPRNQSTSLLRIDEDGPGPAHRYDNRPLIRVEEPSEKTAAMMLPVESKASKKRQSMRRPKEDGKKGDCLVQ